MADASPFATFSTPAAAAAHVKEKALEFGADIVGICAIEPSDVYSGRVVTGRFAIAVGQRTATTATW